jgi:tripartite-type tricarboxylate transporter receptor subunit TctC
MKLRRRHFLHLAVGAIAMTAPSRVPALPDVPAIAETVPSYEASIWYGIAAPRGTPPEIVAKLNQGVNAVLANPKLKERMQELGGDPMPMTPDEFGKLVARETEKWAKVIRSANIHLE